MADSGIAPQDIILGDVYEDCAFIPCFAVLIDKPGDMLTGVSLVDGSMRHCSINNCGPRWMTIEELREAKADYPKWRDIRILQYNAEWRADNGR